MGVIPDGVDPHLVTLLTPIAFEAEPFRMLGHVLERMHQDAGLRVIAISSPAAGDGKTTTAINLAGALAQTPGKRILLVEVELRRPAVVSYLGLQQASGKNLVDAIRDPTLSLEDVVRPCPPLALAILPAGRSVRAAHELLKASRFGELLEEARRCYDCILIDTPPLLPFADCRLIEKWIDGFLVVVAAHKTPRKLLEEALTVIEPAKILGLVFNQDEHQIPGYYSYRYSTLPRNGHHKDRWTFRRRQFP
jgi:capsular exopolysaccharide synthesis family protein